MKAAWREVNVATLLPTPFYVMYVLVNWRKVRNVVSNFFSTHTDLLHAAFLSLKHRWYFSRNFGNLAPSGSVSCHKDTSMCRLEEAGIKAPTFQLREQPNPTPGPQSPTGCLARGLAENNQFRNVAFD